MDNRWQENGRYFLKSRWPELANIETERQKKAPLPEMQKPAQADRMIPLPAVEELAESFGKNVSLTEAIRRRESTRTFGPDPLTIEELAYLLWAAQGVRIQKPRVTFRTVPSGGARHPFETYLFIQRVEGLEPGLYRYLPLDHSLEPIRSENADGLAARLDEALLQHNFGAAVTFVWTAVPERSEYAYAMEAARLILLDAGHVCQNLYLACTAVGCGTCAVGAYDQEKTDSLLGVDGADEFTVYVAPVGKIDRTKGA